MEYLFSTGIRSASVLAAGTLPWVDRSFLPGLAFGFFGGSLILRALYTPDLCFAFTGIFLSIAGWGSGSAVGTSFQPCNMLDVGSNVFYTGCSFCHASYSYT